MSHGKASASTELETHVGRKGVGYDSHCPFCAIACSYTPVYPLDDPLRVVQALNPEKTNPPSQVIYSGEHVLAFLDIQPLTWGHTLVIPRKHRVKMGDLEAGDGAEVSFIRRLFNLAVSLCFGFVP